MHGERGTLAARMLPPADGDRGVGDAVDKCRDAAPILGDWPLPIDEAAYQLASQKQWQQLIET